LNVISGLFNTRWVFPAAFATNVFSVTALVLWVGLLGNPEMAADIAVIQASTIALFYTFSGNARNLILGAKGTVSAAPLQSLRVTLVLPLAPLALVLAWPVVGGITSVVAAILVRRVGEWLVELTLSEAERDGDLVRARSYLIGQMLTFPVVLLMTPVGGYPLLAALAIWALLPMVHFYRQASALNPLAAGPTDWRRLLPQFGSSATIGVGVYVFRLLLVVVAGKALAGELFAAFAVGGLVGSLYAQAIGPTLEVASRAGEGRRMRSIVYAAAALSGVAGLVLYLAAETIWASGFLQKPLLFWEAIGLSLAASFPMVLAQGVRFRILQRYGDDDVFGPDVLINILILTAVPYVPAMFGPGWLAGLYLLSALLHLIIYTGAERRILWEETPRQLRITEIIRSVIACLIVLPLFFLTDGTLFADPEWNFHSGGDPRRLPIPLSAIACFAGIAILAEFRAARKGFLIVFMTFLWVMISAVTIAPENTEDHPARLALALQVVLPMFGLVLGQVFAASPGTRDALGTGLLAGLLLVVPLQVVSALVNGGELLQPKVFFFSIYQHLHYVPVVLTSAWLLCLFWLWSRPARRAWLLALTVCMAVYAALSTSGMARIEFIFGLTAFAVWRTGAPAERLVSAVALLLAGAVAWLTLTGYWIVPGISEPEWHPGRPVSHFWILFGQELFSDVQSLVLGTAERPDVKLYPSAHNYYLDIAFHFGVLSLIPIGILFLMTMRRIVTLGAAVLRDPRLLTLIVVLGFMLLVENSFLVGLRQPYSGIFTFFLWGILLAWLDAELQRRDRAAESRGRL